MSAYLVTVCPREADNHERLYLLAGDLSSEDVQRLTLELLHDPVAHTATWQALDAELAAPKAGALVEIAFRPGVTDNEAETILVGARHIGINGLKQAKTLRRVYVSDVQDEAVLRQYAGEHLLNDLIETAYITLEARSAERLQFYQHLLQLPAPHTPTITRVALRGVSDSELERISREGILALSLSEMQAVRDYFEDLGRDPTDGELETLAQTWSEHCRHKTFRATISYQQTGSDGAIDPALHPALAELNAANGATINGLLNHYLRSATDAVSNAALLSAFVDNAGIVAFDENYEISFKVETHNHPSALEPFGGANTGVGGVVRDVLGVSAKPIAVTDVLCFGYPDLPESELSQGVLHPRRIREGVVAGVRDYGNKLGIPNVNGAVWYDHGYTANPLVFCGTLGIAPRGSHPRGVQPGDAIVVIGGRTGRDGIHGATFSSVELTHDTAETVGAAVQIGDPVTEKTVIDVLLQARDLGLYSAITDCGAGGLSSAVGEMGEETGAVVELRDVPLKYAGLQPWEIWISEAQERMVVSVPPQNVQTLLDLCRGEDVEATVIGHFTADGVLTVKHNQLTVVELDMAFLHSGGVQFKLNAAWQPAAAPAATPANVDHNDLLKATLGQPIVASNENIVRTYDHEVQAATVLKPLVGVDEDGPGDAGVLQPLVDSRRGVVLGCGLNPLYGKIDPYWMALAAVDEALRNIVAAGGDPEQTWILDNFCWGDPKLPDRLAGLVRASAGCHDAALAYRTPFISGKDSLNNEYRDAEGKRVAIPPTLLISAMALVPDVLQTISMDAKAAGNAIYLVGLTHDERGGAVSSLVGGIDNGAVPKVNLATAPSVHKAVHAAIRANSVRACHDLSEGGLAVAAAEMAFAGGFGLSLELSAVPTSTALSADALLWSESATRFLLEVAPEQAANFEAQLGTIAYAKIGHVLAEPRLIINDLAGQALIDSDLAALKAAWQA
ncbi:phosphoribosylformylglycinamidine synthase subunit PurL [Herpetosiphon sp. NSE202]|uniref:phosphoribosylformylglycinamidine synthase subunit PurL n=1 Tax=Herpetosiphon sp. NSE202 TaxID=3351349 RepID=UPI00363B183E